MLLILIQAVTRRPVNLPRREERLTHLGRGMTEKKQMEGEVQSCKDMIPVTDQLPSCQDHMMTKDQNVKSLRNQKAMRLGNKMLRNYSLNKGTRHLERAFSLGKFCTCFLVRGTISFCKGNCNFCLSERVKSGMHQCNSMNNVEEELFRFQLCFIFCKSI